MTGDVFRVVDDPIGLNLKIQKVHDLVKASYTEGTLEVKAGVCVQHGQNDNMEISFMRARLAEATIKGVFDENVAIYADEMGSRERLRNYLIALIDEAVEKEYLKVYYQPVVDSSTNKLCGFEALARWDDPNYGFLSPFDFISILEEAHLIHKLDLFVFAQGLRKLSQRNGCGPYVRPGFVQSFSFGF